MASNEPQENISSMTTPELKQEEADLCQEFERQFALQEATLQESPPTAEACIQLLIKLKNQVDEQYSEPSSDQIFFKALCRAVDDGHMLSALKNLIGPCPICYDPVSNDAPLHYQSCCGQYLHDTCQRQCLEQDDRCPTCRNQNQLVSYSCYQCANQFPLDEFHAPPCWECGQLLCNTCVTIDPSLHYAQGRGQPTCRRCLPNPEEAKEEKEAKQEAKQEAKVDRFTQARELVEQTARNCQGKTLDDLKSEYMVITEMASDGKCQVDDLAHRLRVNMDAVNGNRHLFLLSAYNTGVYLQRYCEEADVSQAQAVRDLKIRGLNKNSASLFVKFADCIDHFECYKFLYACQAPWRIVRALLTTAPNDFVFTEPNDRHNFLWFAFDWVLNTQEEDDLAEALFENGVSN